MTKTTTKTTSMNIRLDEETRRQLQTFADQIGIPATTLAAANIKQMLRSGEVRLTTTLTPTPYLENRMRTADKDLKAGKNLSPVFGTAAEMFDHLKKTA